MKHRISFARWLRAHRVQAGLSQYALAAKLKVSPATVCRWERGQRRPRDYTCRAISQSLNVAVEDAWTAWQASAMRLRNKVGESQRNKGGKAQ